MDEEQLELERVRLADVWHTAFKKGTDYDLWGQPVEAIDGYKRLALQLKQEASPGAVIFPDEQKKVLGKIGACLDLRIKALQNLNRMEGISLEDLNKLESCLKNVLTVTIQDFPLDIHVPVLAVTDLRSPEELSSGYPDDQRISDDERDDDIMDQKYRGTLLPPPAQVPGETVMVVRVEKIGLKEASQYIDSFVTISVHDASGQVICDPQDTPVSGYREEQTVFFGVNAYIQKPLQLLPAGFAIFFEFKHYKPKKKIISTKCWAFMEKDEVKEGPAVIELYKKPTDFRRKNIKLLTVKPLYLHLKITFN